MKPLIRLLGRTGLATLAARRLVPTDGRFVVVLHGVARQHLPGIPRLVQPHHDIPSLRATLTWLAARFSFLTPDQFLHSARPGVLLTFDDGFANNFTNALPLLEAFEAPAIIFVATQHICDPRDWLPPVRVLARQGWGDEATVPDPIASDFFDGLAREQLRACADHPLITIGAHTVTHPDLTTCDDADLARELRESRAQLEAWTSQPIATFAYPTGLYDGRVLTAVQNAGYRAAFAVKPRGAGPAAFEIPRIGLYVADPPYLATKLSGLMGRPSRGPVLPQ